MDQDSQYKSTTNQAAHTSASVPIAKPSGDPEDNQPFVMEDVSTELPPIVRQPTDDVLDDVGDEGDVNNNDLEKQQNQVKKGESADKSMQNEEDGEGETNVQDEAKYDSTHAVNEGTHGAADLDDETESAVQRAFEDQEIADEGAEADEDEEDLMEDEQEDEQESELSLKNAAKRAKLYAAEVAALNAMTLDEKKGLLDKYAYMDYFTKGSFIDAQDTTSAWCLAKIAEVKGNELLVNYDGWSNKWNVWFKIRTYKLAAFRSRSVGYSGQNKVAIRNDFEFSSKILHAMWAEVEKRITQDMEGHLAHDITQWYRGTLFVFVDSLMGQSFEEDLTVLPVVIEFLKSIMRLMVTWINKLTTMQKTFKEYKEVDELYLVDPHTALLASFVELGDILKRIFAGCHRALRYYVFYDENQIDPAEIKKQVAEKSQAVVNSTFGTVVQDFTENNFAGERMVDENKYNPDLSKQRVGWQQDLVFGSLANFAQYFAEIGGFDAVIAALKIGTEPVPKDTKEADKPEKLPLEIVSSLLLPFRNLKEVVTTEFAAAFTDQIKGLIINRFMNLTDKELKEVDKDKLSKVLIDLKQFMSLGMDDSETAQIVEQTQLYIALRFLKSNNLEKRLKGLNDIRYMVERVLQAYKVAKRARNGASTNWQPNFEDKVKPSEHMTTQSMKEWLVENKVLEIILGGDAHLEIVKRCAPILKFMSKYGEGKFDEDTVALVWKCQLGKHEEMVRTVYALIQEILPALALKNIDAFYAKIQELPAQSYDEMFINFLKEFTREALTKKINHDMNEYNRQQELNVEMDDQMNQISADYPKFETVISNKEKLTLSDLKQQVEKSQVEDSDEQEYGMPLLWKIIQNSDSSNKDKVSNEVQELALQSLIEMFSQGFRYLIRLPYLLKSLYNVLKNKSIVQSLQLATAIIKSLKTDHDGERSMQVNFENQDDVEDDDEDNEGGKQLDAKARASAQVPTPEVVTLLQSQLLVIDCLISNVSIYHSQVKQKLKQLVEKGKMPDKVEDYAFVGKYPHGETLQHILDFVEFVITTSQGSAQAKLSDRVELGIENINTLWRLFVNEPNFVSDQNLFLNWVNKQRLVPNPSQQYYHQNNQQAQMMEVFIFTDVEKKYFFKNILCNPLQINVSSISVSQIKCFEKYFKLINREKRAIQSYYRHLKVNAFEELEGKDALWDISIASKVDKARDISQELLVELHLKLDQQTISQESKVEILQNFIKRCMLELQHAASSQHKKGIIQLIALFLDRYEGVRALKPELLSLVYRIPGIKPVMITVINIMDPDNRTSAIIPMYYSQTIGYFRQKVSEQFGLEINEFLLFIKNQIIDADVDDDRYYKDIQGHFQKAFIKKNPSYEKHLHPKHLISNNDEYFDTIFGMLSTEADGTTLLEPVWDLISKLPISDHIKNDLTEMKSVHAAKTQEERTKAWTALFDPHSTFKLLYCIRIIQNTYITPVAAAAAAAEESKDATVLNSLQAWKQNFVAAGGFEHLLNVFKDLNITKVESMLTLKCIKALISTIYAFMGGNGENNSALLQAVAAKNKQLLPLLVQKNINFIDLICSFSIEEEKERGESYDEIQKRLEQAKIKKNRYKMLMTGNKAEEKSKGAGDNDDEDDSEDKKRQVQLMTNFKEQSEIVYFLFNFIETLLQREPLNAQAFIQYSNLKHLMTTGMLQSENIFLRSQMCTRLKELALAFSAKAQQGVPAHRALFQQYLGTIIFAQLDTVLPLTANAAYESRCADFYRDISTTLGSVRLEDIKSLEGEITGLIKNLSGWIINRHIKESNTQEQDLLLQGYLQVLTKLLEKFPQLKLQIGQDGLLEHLVHDCLFEIPTGGKGGVSGKSAPKCKSWNTRRFAFGLVSVLARDCLPNLAYVLNYLKQFNQQPTWRRTKWQIQLYDDEKSSTGHVGIKNLGCICYMNSLNQQLFMIPGFRNDILTIKDPNHDKSPDEDNMFLQWQTLFAGLLLSEKMYVNPKAYCHSFKDWDGNPVNVIEQMDVEEYLGIFLDKLENSIKGTQQEKTIHHHFGGMYANEIICKTCPHQYDRAEQFLYLGVPVKNKKSIYEGMQAFVQGDMLEDQNQYQCEKCDKKVDALKRVCIKKLPRYMIMTLKRFEFDFDRMIRMKVNDYYEFPEQLDMFKFTQEYLNKKEKFEKDVNEQKEKGIEVEIDEFDPEIHAQSKYPKEYFQFELVGIVVHSGTADSGHYYSYIKEQQLFDKVNKETQEDTWYEFNDIWVREFDRAEIPQECFGGEESSYGGSWSNNNQKQMKVRNAYLLVYKRLLEDDSPYEESEEVAEKKENSEVENKEMVEEKVAEFKLGQMELNLHKESEMYQKIAAENHKYWQNKFLFGTEYNEFVSQIALYWNTRTIVPAIAPCRNDDWHLLDPEVQQLAQQNGLTEELAKKPMFLQPNIEESIDLNQAHSLTQLNMARLDVFKFTAQFYVTILQRSRDGMNLPNFVRILKSYINYDIACADWFLSEFANFEILKECFLDNTNKQMRWILAGLIYSAMLKVYPSHKSNLDQYWQDCKNGVEPPRQTTIGTMILALLALLPQVKNFSKHQPQFLQLIARFSSLGAEARLFLMKANTLERMLNFFYWEASPYHEDFINEKQLPLQLKEQPDIGLPTPEDPNAKQNAFALLKERQRLKKMQSEDPKYLYLLETIGNLARTLHTQIVTEGEQTQAVTSPYALENSGFLLSQHNHVLFLPSSEFIQKLFLAAIKPRAIVAITKGYMHYAYHDPVLAERLFETVKGGLCEHDYDKIRPFLVLFEHMLANQKSTVFAQNTDAWLTEFVGSVIPNNQRYFQWMEVIFDFIFKICFRIPVCKDWFAQNQEHWAYLFEWVRKNKEPPVGYMQSNYGHSSSGMKLNKSKYTSVSHSGRNDKNRNQTLYYYRFGTLNLLKTPEKAPDLSDEIDMDQLDLQDYKFIKDSIIDYMDDRFSLDITKAQVMDELDELVKVKFQKESDVQASLLWEPTDKGTLVIDGLVKNTRKYKEMKRLRDMLMQQQIKDQAERKAQQSQWSASSGIGKGTGTGSGSGQRWNNERNHNNGDMDVDGDQDVDNDNEEAGVDEYPGNSVYSNPYAQHADNDDIDPVVGDGDQYMQDDSEEDQQ